MTLSKFLLTILLVFVLASFTQAEEPTEPSLDAIREKFQNVKTLHEMNPHIPEYQFGNRKKQDFEEYKLKLDQLREESEKKWGTRTKHDGLSN